MRLPTATNGWLIVILAIVASAPAASYEGQEQAIATVHGLGGKVRPGEARLRDHG